MCAYNSELFSISDLHFSNTVDGTLHLYNVSYLYALSVVNKHTYIHITLFTALMGKMTFFVAKIAFATMDFSLSLYKDLFYNRNIYITISFSLVEWIWFWNSDYRRIYAILWLIRN